MFLKVFSANLRGSISKCNILNASCGTNGFHITNSRTVQIIAITQYCPTLRYSTEKAASVNKDANKTPAVHQTEQLSSEEIEILKQDSNSFGTLSTFKKTLPEKKANQNESYESERDTSETPVDSSSRAERMSVAKFEENLKDLMKNSSVQEAVRVFEKQLQTKDHITVPIRIYQWLIDECLRFNEFQKAFDIFEIMVNRTLKIPLSTIEKIAAAFETTGTSLKKVNTLRRVIAKRKYEPTEKLYNILVRIYIRSKQPAVGLELADEMVQRGFRYELDTINAMFDGCSSDKSTGFHRLVELWHEMHRLGLTPNVFTMNAFLKAVYKTELNDIGKFQEMLNSIQTKCISKHVESASNTNDDATEVENVSNLIDDGRPNLLETPPKIGRLFPLENVKEPQDRLLILGGLTGIKKTFQSAKIVPNLETITLFLNVIPNTFAAQQKIILMMQKNNITPDANLFTQLLTKTCLRQDFQHAQEIIEMMYAAEFDVDLVSYGLLSLACKSETEADAFFDEVDERFLNIDIFNAMLKNACAALDNNFVICILRKMQTLTKLELTDETIQMVDDYQKEAFRKLRTQRKAIKQARNECFKLSREYKQWLRHFKINKSNETAKTVAETHVTNNNKSQAQNSAI